MLGNLYNARSEEADFRAGLNNLISSKFLMLVSSFVEKIEAQEQKAKEEGAPQPESNLADKYVFPFLFYFFFFRFFFFSFCSL